MPAKKQTIALRADPLGPNYTVIRVTNSTDYRPGDAMTKAQVNVLCKAPRWEVNIVGA